MVAGGAVAMRNTLNYAGGNEEAYSRVRLRQQDWYFQQIGSPLHQHQSLLWAFPQTCGSIPLKGTPK